MSTELEEQRLRRARIEVLAAQARAGAIVGATSVLGIGILLGPLIGPWAMAAWAAALLGTHAFRARVIARMLSRPVATERDERFFSITGILIAFIINAPAPFVVPMMDPLQQGIWIATMVSWVAVVALMIGMLPRTYAAFIVISYGLELIGWWRVLPVSYAVAVSLWMIVAGIVLWRFAQQVTVMFEESFRIRNENEQLVVQLQQSIAETEAAQRARSRFLAAASHDLIQPVHALKLVVDVLARSSVEDVRQDALQRVRWISHAIEGMFRGLLDQARLDAGSVVPRIDSVELFAVLRSIHAAYQQGASDKGIALAMDCAPDLRVRTDPALLDRMVRNIVDNAVKFTEQGGVQVAATLAGAHAVVTVTDSGMGIPEADIAHVFEAFYRSERAVRGGVEGVGLGLSVTGQLAEMLDIGIELERRAEGGTRIVLRIPVDTAASAKVPDLPENAPMQRSALRLLLVEDDRQARTALELWFLEEGCDVCVASSLAAAIEACEARAFVPEMIVSDLNLGPGEPDGFQVIEHFQRMHGPVRAAIVTGESMDEATKSRGIAILKKPVVLDELHELLLAGDPPGG